VDAREKKYMFGFVSKKKKHRIHFLHIRKTGGSAIKSVLQDFLEMPDYCLKLHKHKTTLHDIPRGDSVVFFLRDPVSRFISGFYSRQRKGLPLHYSEWRPEEKEVFEHFSAPNEIAVALADKRSHNHSLAIMAMKSIRHFTSYKHWYVDFDYFNTRRDDILFIGFQESLNVDFAALKMILGIPRNIYLPTDDITAHKNPKNIHTSIDAGGISALKEWYVEDYTFIALCREIMSARAMTGVSQIRRV
jgi:hypothetical protein